MKPHSRHQVEGEEKRIQILLLLLMGLLGEQLFTKATFTESIEHPCTSSDIRGFTQYIKDNREKV
jgi:hypothetical protein